MPIRGSRDSEKTRPRLLLGRELRARGGIVCTASKFAATVCKYRHQSLVAAVGLTDSQPAGMFTRRRAPLSCRACAPATPRVQEELHATQCARRQRAKNRNSVALLAAGYTLERLPNLHNCGEERVDPCTYAVFHSYIVRLLCVYSRRDVGAAGPHVQCMNYCSPSSSGMRVLQCSAPAPATQQHLAALAHSPQKDRLQCPTPSLIIPAGYAQDGG